MQGARDMNRSSLPPTSFHSIFTFFPGGKHKNTILDLGISEILKAARKEILAI